MAVDLLLTVQRNKKNVSCANMEAELLNTVRAGLVDRLGDREGHKLNFHVHKYCSRGVISCIYSYEDNKIMMRCSVL